MTGTDTTELTCPVCSGRGYHPCACWPGDCICGFGDQECENCGGTGRLYPYEYEELYEAALNPEGEA